MIKFGKETRKFIADVSVKIAEYLLSIVILGTIISGHINRTLLIGSGVIFVILIIVAIILISTTENNKKEE